MKKSLQITFAVILVLALGLSTMAFAQGNDPNPFDDGDGPIPYSVDTFTIDPSSAPIGDTVTFEGDYTVPNPGTDQIDEH